MLEFFEFFGLTNLIMPIGILIVVLLPIFYLLFLKKFLSALGLFAFIILWSVVTVFVFINAGKAFITFENASIDASIAILFSNGIIGLALYLVILFNALRSSKVEEQEEN